MKPEKTEKLLVTPTEACQLLGVGRTTMYTWIKEERIPIVKFPKCRNIYISTNTLNQLINDNTIPEKITKINTKTYIIINLNFINTCILI